MVYRPKHHLTAPQGRLGAPSGLMLIDDSVHTFYQHNPQFPAEPLLTGWGHAAVGSAARDGTWRHYPMALNPDFQLGSRTSGCAVAVDGRVRLFHTAEGDAESDVGAVITVAEGRNVSSPMGGMYRKSAGQAVATPEGYIGAARDPHVTRAADGTWRMVASAQRENHTGAVLLYTSPDLDQPWEFAGEIEFAGLNYNTASAHHWRYPNLISMWDHTAEEMRDVIVFCPQFPDSEECGYVVGRLDGVRFEVLRDFTPLDYGHDFYAPHLIPLSPGGALAIALMGQPARATTPAFQEEGWLNSFTLLRELSLSDAHLSTIILIPAGTSLVGNRVDIGSTEFSADLVDAGGNVGASVHWQPHGDGRGTLSLSVDGLVRWADCDEGEVVFVADGAAVELTAGTGEVAFASAVFAEGGVDWAELRVN